jgi:hypothetical protein
MSRLKYNQYLGAIPCNSLTYQGPQGYRGPKGPIGPTGYTGSLGPTGYTGSLGPTGSLGESLWTLTPPADTTGAIGGTGTIYSIYNLPDALNGDVGITNNLLLAGSQTFSDNSVLISARPDLLYPNINFNNVSLIWKKTNSTAQEWSSIALSSSGQYQTAVTSDINNQFGIYNSSDYGVTWIVNTTVTQNQSWIHVAISSSGQYQTAVTPFTNITSFDGHLYNSSDYGVTWNINISNITSEFISVSVSASGQYQTAVSNIDVQGQNPGSIYISSNYGINWDLVQNITDFFSSIAVSSSGQYQTAVTNEKPCSIYISNNYGVTWIKTITRSTDTEIISIAISSSGQYQTALFNDIPQPPLPNINGGIYTSSNYGVTWIKKTTPLNEKIGWKSISMDSSGKYQLASNQSVPFYYSCDYGTTWVNINPIPNFNNTTITVAMSSSGQYLTAVCKDSPQFIYTTVIPYNNLTIGNFNMPVNIQSTDISGSLYVSGNAYATKFYSTSDYRIKENVQNLNAQYTVDNMRPVIYTNKLEQKEDIGLIAHELKEHYPFLVNGEKDGENLQSINYNGLIGILIKEIKQLKNDVIILQNQNTVLENIIYNK